ncbi:MAG: toxin-antitoxin system YwqK family antitoxin [Sandaracinaceae bacterium]
MDRPSSDAQFDFGYGRWVSGQFDGDGLRTGVWQHHREDGSRYSEIPWVAGLPEGVARHFHPNGTVAAESHWNGAFVEHASYVRSEGSDLPFFERVAPSVARIEARAGAAFTWGELRYFDRSGSEVNAQGVCLPDRATGVPRDAQYVSEGASPLAPMHWVSGDVEQGSSQPVGHRTWHSARGDLLHHALYDDRGRPCWSRLALALDPVPGVIAAFVARPRHFPIAELRPHFGLALHASLRDTLANQSTAHVAAYASALRYLDRRDGRTQQRQRPRWDLILELFEDWVERDEEVSSGTVDLLRVSVEAMLALRQKAAVERWWPALRAHDDTLATRVEALLSGPSSWSDAVVGLGAMDPKRVLGDDDHGLIVDAFERAFWVESGDVSSAPLTVDRDGPTLSRHMLPFGRSDAGSLYFGADGWWLRQRYGPHLLLSTSRFDEQSFRHETDLDLFVHCPDATWTRRLASLFDRARPAGMTEVVDGAVDGDVLLREYTSSVDRPQVPRRRFLGGTGSRLVSGHGAPPDDGHFPARRNEGGVELVSIDVDDAGARLDREETILFQQGHVLHRLVPESELE